MTQLEKIKKRLLDRDRYLLIPTVMKDSPVPMAKMQKDGIDGTPLLNPDNTPMLDIDGNPMLNQEIVLKVGEYYSPQDLANHFGSFYTILPWVDDAHVLITWGASENGEMEATKSFMALQGLVNVRDNGTEFELEADKVDWSTIPANGFAILSLSDLRDVPKTVNPTIEEMMQ